MKGNTASRMYAGYRTDTARLPARSGELTAMGWPNQNPDNPVYVDDDQLRDHAQQIGNLAERADPEVPLPVPGGPLVSKTGPPDLHSRNEPLPGEFAEGKR